MSDAVTESLLCELYRHFTNALVLAEIETLLSHFKDVETEVEEGHRTWTRSYNDKPHLNTDILHAKERSEEAIALTHEE